MSYSYIDETLMPNETVIFRTRPHWIVFAPAFGWLLLIVVSIIFLPFSTIGQLSFGTHDLYTITATVGLIGLLINGVMAYVEYQTSEYGVTDKRVLVKIGFIRRRTLEILLPKIESIQVFQSIPGRLLDYGTVVISGTGGSHDAFRNLPNPLQFRRHAQAQAESLN